MLDTWQKELFFSFVGDVTLCRIVCTDFVPKDYVRFIRFNPNATENTISSILNLRSGLKLIDFTGSLYLTTPFFKDLYSTLDSVEVFILNKCDRILFLPYSCVSTRIRVDRNERPCILSLRGCWRIFPEPLPCLSATDTVEIVLCAMNNGTSAAMKVLSSYFRDRVSVQTLKSSCLVRYLNIFRAWRIFHTCYVGDKCAAVVNVQNYSIIVVVLKNTDGCWEVMQIFSTSINEILARTSYFDV